MKIKRFTLLTLPVLALAIGYISLSSSKEDVRYFPREYHGIPSTADGFLDFMEKVKADKQTGAISPDDVFAARKQADKLPKSKASLNINWNFVGPDNIGGRTRALIIDKNDPDHLVAGGVAGGVFESFNGARSWQRYDKNSEVTEVTNVSCITQSVDGSFYIGTGGHFENSRGAGSSRTDRSYFFVGSGIYKLTGDGNYELVIGPSSSGNPNVDYATIGEIVASPTDNNKLYVAMNNGFRILTIDPNSGNVTESDPIGRNQKCDDISVSSDGKVVVTYPGRIYVSQGGDANFANTTPVGMFSRIETAISEDNTDIMYASAASINNCLGGIFKSRDSGQTWEIIAKGGTTVDMFANPGVNCQGSWDNVIAIYPGNPEKIVVGGVTLYQWEQSTTDPEPVNGSWRQIDILTDFTPGGEQVPNYVHADKHEIVFDPRNPNIAYIASDGGIAKSTDFDSEAPTFEEVNYNYGVTQYYAIGVNYNGVVSGGTQDNGTHIVGFKNTANKVGEQVIGGDGFDAEMSMIDPSIGFGSVYNNEIRRIQGIGTDPGNSNLATADLTTTNSFFNAACQQEQGCSNEFYTVTTFWESFNHEESNDSVTILLEKHELPPIAESTVIPFEGNNNDYPQEYVVETNGGVGIFPFDTISGSSGEMDTVLLSSLPFIQNFDTLLVDEQAKTITVRRRGDATFTPLVINYTLGEEEEYNNLLVNQNVSVLVDTFDFGDNNGELYLAVEEMNPTFRYSFKVQDKVQSIYATANWPTVSGGNFNYSEQNVFITRDLLKGTESINWYHIAGANSTPHNIDGSVLDMEFSPDGDHLFIATDAGSLFRVSGINGFDAGPVDPTTSLNFGELVDSGGYFEGKCYEIGRFPGQSVTDIAVDPNNSDNVVVALGNYGRSTYVARTTNATTATSTATFETIQGSGSTALPFAPAYSVLINQTDPNKVLIGTELGVFGTDNAFTANASNVEWTEENIGLGRVPVFEIKQVRGFDSDTSDTSRINNIIRITHDSIIAPITNGRIYIGTHGRGIFYTDIFVGLDDKEGSTIDDESKTFKNSMKMFPNPVQDIGSIEFKIEDVNAPVLIDIYNIRGQKVKEEKLSRLNYGKNTRRLNFSDLDRGTYIIRAVHQNQVFSTKFIKQ